MKEKEYKIQEDKGFVFSVYLALNKLQKTGKIKEICTPAIALMPEKLRWEIIRDAAEEELKRIEEELG